MPSRPDLRVEDGEVEDDEEVVVVDVDLRPLVAGEDVLEVEGVEVEVGLEPGALERARALDVDPAQAGGVDLLDVGVCGSACGAVPASGSPRRVARRSLGFGRFGIVLAHRGLGLDGHDRPRLDAPAASSTERNFPAAPLVGCPSHKRHI